MIIIKIIKNNQKKTAKDDQEYQKFYPQDTKQNKYPTQPKRTSEEKYNTKPQPKINDWVIVNIQEDKRFAPTDKEKMYFEFINDNIGQIVQRAELGYFFVEYQNIPNEIKSFFTLKMKTFHKTSFEYFSSDKDSVIDYLIRK